ESMMDEPVLTFSPVLGCIAGIVFLAKAGMLSGRFYIHAGALFATSIIMAAMQRQETPNFSISLFGVVSALAFFLPGFKYYRQQKQPSRR
ncbi:MAG: serine/threonine protein kinase, partial [Fuerstiella sp.]|nr:serine/threonine protein kinase [Fuerstiella sp.]